MITIVVIISVECAHEWEIEHSSTITRIGLDPKKPNTIGSEYIYICKKCTQRKYIRTELLISFKIFGL